MLGRSYLYGRRNCHDNVRLNCIPLQLHYSINITKSRREHSALPFLHLSGIYRRRRGGEALSPYDDLSSPGDVGEAVRPAASRRELAASFEFFLQPHILCGSETRSIHPLIVIRGANARLRSPTRCRIAPKSRVERTERGSTWWIRIGKAARGPYVCPSRDRASRSVYRPLCPGCVYGHVP